MRPIFEQRVLAITEDIMAVCRLLVEDGLTADDIIAQPDLIVAAPALEHGLTIVSRHVSDDRTARVPVLNPWIASVPAGP